MGNTESSNTSTTLAVGIRRAQNAKEPMYRLVNISGGGEMIDWIRTARKTGEYSLVDGFIEVKVTGFLYSRGKGKLVSISEIVKRRNKERNATLGTLRKKKGKGKSGPNILEDIDQSMMQGDMMKALKFLDGGGKGKDGSKYRELCWELDKRGIMGETLLHLCLLNGTAVHNDLAKRLVTAFPKLVNDICVSEDYYGQSPLHQAIVNEDPSMVRFLILHGADVHQRCCGAFFCPEDQRATRTDSLEHEWVDVAQKTSYKGRTYWGEYPLSFAACLRQVDCFRLLRAAKADVNRQDTNGNSVLHMMVIHEFPDMFDIAHKNGGKLQLQNNQGLTPLTLAAKLAKRSAFNHVLQLERDVLWTHADVTCVAYPLHSIDTIDEKTGKINQKSSMALIVYGNRQEHLELLDGLMEDILGEKWNAYAKTKLIAQFVRFVIYACIVVGAFYFRNECNNPSENDNDEVANHNTSHFGKNCLWEFKSTNSKVRGVLEILTVCGVILYLVSVAQYIRNLGFKAYMRSLQQFPARRIFHFSYLCVVVMIPLRLLSYRDPTAHNIETNMENLVAIVTALCTTTHFLFYCRAVGFIGPFVLMIYKMIRGDMLRFALIYSVFLVGFSQSFYVIFTYCGPGIKQSVMPNFIESFNRMFIISVGEFSTFYKALNRCPASLAALGKILFVIYELIVTVMLINMLIAMMGRTYQEIAETQKEWKRQWAQVILMIEESMKPSERLAALLKYSRPIGTDKSRRAFVSRRLLTEEEKVAREQEKEKKWRKFEEERRAAKKALAAMTGEKRKSIMTSLPRTPIKHASSDEFSSASRSD